jgi:hypothetical protein
MSGVGDDQLLDALATQPGAQPDPARTSLVAEGDAPTIDTNAALGALRRGYARVRDLLATARQAIQDIRAKDAAQDARLDAIEARLTKGGL